MGGVGKYGIGVGKYVFWEWKSEKRCRKVCWGVEKVRGAVGRGMGV